jgi:hypothetical protein
MMSWQFATDVVIVRVCVCCAAATPHLRYDNAGDLVARRGRHNTAADTNDILRTCRIWFDCRTIVLGMELAKYCWAAAANSLPDGCSAIYHRHQAVLLHFLWVCSFTLCSLYLRHHYQQRLRMIIAGNQCTCCCYARYTRWQPYAATRPYTSSRLTYACLQMIRYPWYGLQLLHACPAWLTWLR